MSINFPLKRLGNAAGLQCESKPVVHNFSVSDISKHNLYLLITDSMAWICCATNTGSNCQVIAHIYADLSDITEVTEVIFYLKLHTFQCTVKQEAEL